MFVRYLLCLFVSGGFGGDGRNYEIISILKIPPNLPLTFGLPPSHLGIASLH